MSSAVTESSFEQEVLQSDKPVIVDFWAEWCGPCHAVSPVLDKIVEERDNELKLVKVNIDEEPSLAQKYGIVSIPTISSSGAASRRLPRSAPSRRAPSRSHSAWPRRRKRRFGLGATIRS